MKPAQPSPNRPGFIIPAALILNIFLCGGSAISMAINLFMSPANYPPLNIGPITLPPVFHHIDLLWPMLAAILSALSLFRPRGFRILGVLFGLSFSLFMSALMIHHYADSLEYDPNRMGGIIETALVWTALFTVNGFAVVKAIQYRRRTPTP